MSSLTTSYSLLVVIVLTAITTYILSCVMYHYVGEKAFPTYGNLSKLVMDWVNGIFPGPSATPEENDD